MTGVHPYSEHQLPNQATNTKISILKRRPDGMKYDIPFVPCKQRAEMAQVIQRKVAFCRILKAITQSFPTLPHNVTTTNPPSSEAHHKTHVLRP